MLAGAARRVEADYVVPFLAHATMEPQNCTAHVKPDGVEVWVPTQDPATALATAAIAAGVPNDKVTVHRMMLGGGFGRRAPIQEYVRQAVVIAKEFEQPVKLVWSREEDIAHDLYRPYGMARLVAGLDAEGMPTAWRIRLAGPSFVASLVPGFGANIVDRSFVSGLAEEMPTTFRTISSIMSYARRRCRSACGAPSTTRRMHFIRNASSTRWRTPRASTLICTGASSCPRARKISPCSTPRLRRRAGAASSPPGVFRGIALSEGCGSYCAQVVEASVTDGRVRVHRVVSAIDSGHVVNPLSVEMQTQGAVVYALTAALYGEITIKDGAAEQSNFDTYEMLRLADAPKVETVIVPSGDFWGGVGEPPVPPLAPALCNAIFAATGKRIRSLPVKNHDLTKAI